MTEQYFLIRLKSFSSCFFPVSSCHFLLYLVNAFFLLFALEKKPLSLRIRKELFQRIFSQLNICVLHTPVPIKSTPALVTEMLSKDGFQSTQTPDRPNITHNPQHNDGRGLNDGYSLHFLSLGHLCNTDKNGTTVHSSKPKCHKIRVLITIELFNCIFCCKTFPMVSDG